MSARILNPGRVGLGLYFVDSYNNTANTSIHGQGTVAHQAANGAWWRYAAWYGVDRNVRVGRQDPDGAWDVATLPIALGPNDSHNTIALGVSRGDGRLHLVAGQHADPMFYTRTATGSLDLPGPWLATGFAAPSSTLAGTVVGDLTYPTFTATPGGDLLYWYRNGGSGNGRMRLATYESSTSMWTVVGDVSSAVGNYTAPNGIVSATRNLYWAAPVYGADGALHIIGMWREGNVNVRCNPGQPFLNHHVVHVRSTDNGLTWLNGAGEQVAETGVTPLAVGAPGILADPNTDIPYCIQALSASALGPGGAIGYLPDYVRGGRMGTDCVYSEAFRIDRASHHPRWRDPVTGIWGHQTIQVDGVDVDCEYPVGRAGRGHFAWGPNGHAYAFLAGLRVYSAPPPYTNWTPTFDGPGEGLKAFGEMQIDRTREAEGRVAFLYAEQSTGSSGPVCVREFVLTD